MQAIPVDGVEELLRIADRQIALVTEFFPGQDQRNADGRQQASEGQLEPLFLLGDAARVEEMEQPLVAGPLDVVRSDVVHRLGAVAETGRAAIHDSAHGVLEGGIVAEVAAHDGGADALLPRLVPQRVQAVLTGLAIRCLLQDIERHLQLFTDDQKAILGLVGRATHLGEGRAGVVTVFAQEVPVGHGFEAVEAETIDVEIANPALDGQLEEMARGDHAGALAGRRLRARDGIVDVGLGGDVAP